MYRLGCRHRTKITSCSCRFQAHQCDNVSASCARTWRSCKTLQINWLWSLVNTSMDQVACALSNQCTGRNGQAPSLTSDQLRFYSSNLSGRGRPHRTLLTIVACGPPWSTGPPTERLACTCNRRILSSYCVGTHNLAFVDESASAEYWCRTLTTK